MIHSFLNLCRACPMPTNDKFTEYKQNYKWYENYAVTSDYPGVGRKSTDLKAATCEPAIQRRKKHPEVAYRSNDAVYQLDPAIAADRARSKEKSMANSRSRSADPDMGRKSVVINPISDFVVPYNRSKCQANADPLMTQSFPPPAPPSASSSSSSGVHKSRTEYRCQYGWPLSARKSVSLHSIKGSDKRAHVVITKQPPLSSRLSKVTEYKAKFRPFSAYEYVDGSWKQPVAGKMVMSGLVSGTDTPSWYQEVVDTRKKAEENRTRQRFSALESDHFEDLYKRQVALWSQVSSRYMLSALSLASSQHTPKKKKSGKTPTTAPVPRRSSQSPQKSPQKKVGDTVDGSRHPQLHQQKKASPRPLHIKQPSPTTASIPNRPRSGQSSDTSLVKSDSTRPRSPKKAYNKSSPLSQPSAQPKAAHPAKPKKTDEKRTNRPTSLAAAPKMKQQTSARDNLPRTHSKPKQKTPTAAVASSVPQAEGKIWLKPEKKKESPAADKKPGELDGCSVPEAAPGVDKQQPDAAIVNGVPSPRTDSPPPLPEPSIVAGGPVTLTHVRSPEEVTGIKSPDPETWTVPLRKSQPLNWTDGQVESPMSDSGRTNTPASHNSPHHLAQKPKPATDHQPPPHSFLEENGPQQQGHNASTDQSSEVPRNPEQVLDKARSRLDEFWNSSN